MNKDIYLSIIIPAHNEAKRLPSTLEKILSFLKQQNYTSEVLIIENGSQDDTFRIAQHASQNLSNAQVTITAIHEEQKGKGRAVQRGMLAAQGAYRFMADADLSMPIEEISLFLPPLLNNYDVAIGSREANGAVRYNEPLYRHWGGRFINLLIRWLALPGLRDTQCGFKCFTAQAAENLFKLQTQMGWAFDVEILFLARKHHYRIVEVPIHWYFNPESKLNLVRDTIQMIRDIYSIRKNSM